MTALKQLFNFFEADLARHLPEQAGGFICPLCLQKFPVMDKELLNRAHLWPESLGGRIYTLACQRCNSEIGSRIEKHEVQRVKYISQSQIPFRQQIDGVEGITGGLLEVKSIDSKPTLTMKISDKFSNPETLMKQSEAFGKGLEEVRSTLIFPTGYNYRVALLTYLHFAYITLFHLLGYRWITTLLAEHIRQQLKFPERLGFPISLILFADEEATSQAETIEPIIFEIMAPSQLKGFLVTTPALKHEGDQRLAIWIPKSFNPTNKIEGLDKWSGTDFTYRVAAIVGRKPGQLFPERLPK